MSVRLCVFDAYGTLFDVDAAAQIAAKGPGGDALAESWPCISAVWRRKQLEYTWLRAAAGHHADFAQVTEDALDWALEDAGLADDGLRARLLALYQELPVFAEVPEVLRGLAAQGMALAILSNGTPSMLASALRAAGLQDMFQAVLSVEDVGVFKPAGAVYDMVGKRFGTAPQEVLFISSNGWDICAGAAYGFRTLWVNRAGAPVDRLFGRPDAIARDLHGVLPLPGDI
ncbi:haloacid dehalogenase type II [Roseinatronobacter alkalisoli]|uniref:(S)-2-haloacid dehalogenase n=1 Tax=Roseinatronobacter alkalisoli TaxID=3028235 RepID=A0ABT5T9K9_9RHOB|nr:haloacid dehalogenase type II [Roseinatronobacter sp. HJB301]MDD7971661.1 haloacid dehalogenase type II [Roseinatronobacter sp. HJB301]